MIGLGLGIGISRSSGFNIASIFANGEQGVWLEPWDLTTMFQDSAGTIPVTAVGQPVGLRLDKSKGLVIGAEKVVNGGFDSDVTGWTVSAGATFTWSAGKGAYTRNSFGGRAYQAIACDVGKVYEISITLSGITGGSVRVGFLSSLTTASNITETVINGTKTARIQAKATTMYIEFDANANAASFSVDDISIKEIAGNHAYQTTATARPIYNGFVDFDGIDDAHNIVFQDLGSDVTIARAVPGVGVSILTGQTIGAGTWAFNTDDNGLIIVNRALTPAETAGVTAYLNVRI
ncbi:hypothetical protein V2P20_08990 [Methylobacter sp. Wu1]|uniref:hypothetical protein n=1 Tax=Methylobacter sp. Wu1 TaxID=3119359 RepID=UPI002F94B361